MIAWFARNSVAANLLMISIFGGGLFAALSVAWEIFPSSDPDTITVSVSLRGATPEDVELGIAVRIEEAVHDLEGIKQIVSRSVEGGTTVAIELEPDADRQAALNDVKSRVDSINTFPGDAEKPIISLSVRTRPVISVVISGDFPEDEIRLYTEQIRDDLLRIEGTVSYTHLTLPTTPYV